jgi:hypothetical protein
VWPLVASKDGVSLPNTSFGAPPLMTLIVVIETLSLERHRAAAPLHL